MTALVFCRTLLGFFEAGHWPCALKTTQLLLPPKDRTFGNSILQSGTSIGAIVTPIIVAAMLTSDPASWRAPFLMIGAAGMLWVFGWFQATRGKGETAQPASTAEADGGTWIESVLALLRDHRFWLLAAVVCCINGAYSIYRVWLPLALQDPNGLAYSEDQTLQQILPIYYLINDVGCLGAGAATVWLHRKGMTPANARRWIFTLSGALMLAAMQLPAIARGEWTLPGLSAGQAAMVVLLMTALGSLAPFPCYYAFTQDLSTRHMGLVTGLLSFCAWVVPSSIQRMLGAEIDRSGAYDIAFHVASWPVLAAAVALWLFWDVGWLRVARR